MAGNEDVTLLFEKKESLIWSVLESKDVFKRLPQKPHFRALEEFGVIFREREAIGCMLDFCRVVESSCRLEFLNETMTRTAANEFSQRLFKLEQNGFNLKIVRDHMVMRQNVEELRDQQISDLNSKRTELEAKISDVERRFKTSVAAYLGLTDKYETSDRGEFSTAMDKNPAVDLVENELKTGANSQVEKGKGVVNTEEKCNKTQRRGKKEIISCSEAVSKTAKGADPNQEEDDDQFNEEAKEPSEESDDVCNVDKDTGEYFRAEDAEDTNLNDDISESESESGQDGLWDELNMHITEENCKDRLIDSTSADQTKGNDGANICDHQLVMKDDLGLVCRVCGFVKKEIEKIIEYSFGKKKETERSYRYDSSSGNNISSSSEVPDGTRLGDDLVEVPVHPRHRKFMKAHQFEGLSFLMSNLMTENPGGCVMAHAPGSGKTFMVISFLQVFMTRYPCARPLIVLPKGIIPPWKREFQKWQVEDLPLYDFYSVKADSRGQQLEILRKWGNERSILFLSYKQFTVIVRKQRRMPSCDRDSETETNEECRQFLVVSPSVLILDVGHNTRNEETETLLSVAKVRTPRKVILSGTLYQNSVKEVFNVLNLVRPNFLKTDFASSVQRRIMSKLDLSRKNLEKVSDDRFYEAVERTIVDGVEMKRKVKVIQDLRDMTSKILHYYKGDSLDELPGLVDFTVFLKLSQRQKKDIEVLKKCKNSFKIHSDGSAIYLHPGLNSVLRKDGAEVKKADMEKIDLLLQNASEVGAKARFFLDLAHLCEATGEKLLVFSQYLGPLKFLERLAVKIKNYSLGKELFMITGNSSQEIRDSSMEQFNSSSGSRILFGSIKACGEGISLVGASRIIILDVHLNPSVTRQAIGRAFRPGQKRKVYTYRLVASGSPEEDDHGVCFRKECVSKMWFEWNGYSGLKNQLEMETVDIKHCGDLFLETNERLKADVVSVSKRVGSKEGEKLYIDTCEKLDASFVRKLDDIDSTVAITKEPDKLDLSGSTDRQLETISGEKVQRKKANGSEHHARNTPTKRKRKTVDYESDPEYLLSKSRKRSKGGSRQPKTASEELPRQDS